MSQQVGKGTLATIIAVVVVVLGIVAWKVFGPAQGSSEAEIQERQRGQMQGYQRQGAPTPGAMQGTPGGAMPGAPGAPAGVPPAPR
jgi:hypothetical protein